MLNACYTVMIMVSNIALLPVVNYDSKLSLWLNLSECKQDTREAYA